MRARAVIGSILLVLSAPLAACGEEQDATKAGDIIKARTDNQFEEGKEASVTLPTGRLLIHAGEPVDSATGDDTRTREKVDAPAGGALVPIGWQYDPWDKDRLDGIVNTTENPTIDLVSGEEHYRLPPPELEAEGGDSFYVVVHGDAEDRSLEIEFDGVKQSVDLATGRTDEGDAAALYDIDEGSLKKKPCDDEQWFDTAMVAADFSCDFLGPVLTPYAAGKWAPAGSLWLAVTLQTVLQAYGEVDGLGGGARYTARGVKVKLKIDGVPPAFVLSTEDYTDSCPNDATLACGWSRHVVFEVPESDGEQGPLDIEVTYRLALTAMWGDWNPPEQAEVEADETLKLWEDEDEQEQEDG